MGYSQNTLKIGQTATQEAESVVPGAPVEPVVLPGGTWGLIGALLIALLPKWFNFLQGKRQSDSAIFERLLLALERTTERQNAALATLSESVNKFADRVERGDLTAANKLEQILQAVSRQKQGGSGNG